MENAAMSKQEIAKYDASILELREKVNKYERAYESLRQFKGMVLNSYGSFETVNSKKSAVLSQLDSIKSKNPVAKKYKNGMSNSLTGIGMTIVGKSFQGFLVMVNIKLAQYRTEIEICDKELSALEMKKEKARVELLKNR